MSEVPRDSQGRLTTIHGLVLDESNPLPTLRELRFTAIDFESAGAARGQTDTPVQIGLAQWSLARGHESPFVS